MRKLLVALILLAVLVGVLDRVAVAGAEREIARQVEAAYDLNAPPTVEIKGIPFLTQALSGRYEEIAVSMGPMTREGVRLSGIEATLYGVTAPLADLIQNAAATDIRAERVTGTVEISKETLDARAPRGISIEGAGEDGVRVKGNVTVLGNSIPVTATMRIQVEEGGLRLTPTKVELAQGVNVPNAERLISFRVPIKELPLSLKITKVRTTPEGLAVDATATDVPLRA